MRDGGDLSFLVTFENLGPGTEDPPAGQPLATAPAALVEITVPLDDDLDPATVELTQLGFGDVLLDVPPGRRAWSTVVPRTVPVPDGAGGTRDVAIEVHVEGVVDDAARALRWRLEATNPATGIQPADPLAGFLPPEPVDDEGAGQGLVGYVVRQRDGLATGTALDAQPTITFDRNAPIATNTWHNTVDGTAPAAAVASLPAQAPAPVRAVLAGLEDPVGPVRPENPVDLEDLRGQGRPGSPGSRPGR